MDREHQLIKPSFSKYSYSNCLGRLDWGQIGNSRQDLDLNNLCSVEGDMFVVEVVAELVAEAAGGADD